MGSRAGNTNVADERLLSAVQGFERTAEDWRREQEAYKGFMDMARGSVEEAILAMAKDELRRAMREGEEYVLNTALISVLEKRAREVGAGRFLPLIRHALANRLRGESDVERRYVQAEDIQGKVVKQVGWSIQVEPA